jgi:hypothetical protein
MGLADTFFYLKHFKMAKVAKTLNQCLKWCPKN